MTIDFEAEGLLAGAEGEARVARRALLEELHAAGVPLEELRTAVAEGRLALLPVERELSGDALYTLEEIAEIAEIDAPYLLRQREALGLPRTGLEERTATEDDLAAARRIRILLDAGLPEEGLLEVSRVIGLSMSQIAAANRSLVRSALVREGDTERDVARRFVSTARALRPLLAETLADALRLHVLEQVRHDALDAGSLDRAEAGTEVTACFADLVGFTRLGERVPVDELGAVTNRLNELAASVASGPVRLVKLIGDGAMLVGVDNDAVLEAALELVAAAEGEADAGFPQLRAGVARGLALARAGDWYGPPVNAAARITGIAYPGSVLASQAAKEAAAGEFRFSFAGERRLKGIREELKLYRVRRGEQVAAGR